MEETASARHPGRVEAGTAGQLIGRLIGSQLKKVLPPHYPRYPAEGRDPLIGSIPPSVVLCDGLSTVYSCLQILIMARHLGNLSYVGSVAGK